MSGFSNKMVNSDLNKVLKLTEKQVFENDYERLKNKFNFGNINLNKNINSFPLRLSSPNYNETSSINNSKNERNNYINTHKICYNYPSKGNREISEDINIDKIHNFIQKNNFQSNYKQESRNTSLTNNFCKQESITSKSKEKLIVNYNIKHKNHNSNQNNRKISCLKRELSTTDGKNRRTANTHASTDFKFSDKSIDMTSSNNSFISHSFLNNMNNNFNQKHIPSKASQDFQAKIERYHSNGNLFDYLATNNTNIKTQATSQSNYNFGIEKDNEKINNNLIKNGNGQAIHHKKVNSNIIAYNNFNKSNKMNINFTDKKNNYSVKNAIKNINTSSHKNLPRNEINKNDISHMNNKTITTTKSISTSINISRGGTPTTNYRFNEESIKMKSSKNKEITATLKDKKADLKLFKITEIKVLNANKNNIIKAENISLINKVFDSEPKSIKKEVNDGLNYKDQKNHIDNAKLNRNKDNNVIHTNNSEKTNVIFDETERKTDRCLNINTNNIQNDEENDIAFANALEDLSQSNESSINELIQPLNRKSNTYSSQNIPSEENVERKDVIYSDKVLINNDKYQKSRDNMNVDMFVEELDGKNTEYSKDKNEAEEELDNYDSFENYAMHQINTRNLFVNNPVYDLSSRLINDEKANQPQVVKNLNELKFIEKIKKDGKNNYLSIKKFWVLNDDCICNILAFSFQFFQEMIKSNAYLAKKLYLTLSNKFSHVIYSFREKFKEYLELEEFLFRPGVVKKHRAKKPNNVIDLVLKSRIKSSLFNNTFEISFSFKFLNNSEEYINVWKFDLKNKSDISLWFASEAEEYKNNIIRHCYFHPIISFYTDDVVRMRINIFSKMGIIDPESIRFNEICIYNSPKHDFTEYEKSILKNNKKFEKMRICELENMVHLWKNEKSLSNKANIDEFKKYFSSFFKIYDISYDFAKFYIFKVKMEAKNIGLIKKNKFTNFDLEIKPWREPLINETQCLGLLNINQILPKVEIRIGTYVLFYFTDLYI